MRKSTENLRNRRALADYFSQRNTVKDVADWQCSRPHSTSFHQETPMKPYQVPNWPFYPPPKRMLPHSSPELCSKDRPNPQRPPPHSPGSFRSLRFGQNYPANVGSFVSQPHPMPKGKLGPPQHSIQPPRPITGGPSHILNSAGKPQSMSGVKERPRQRPVQTSPVQLGLINAATSMSKPQPSPPNLLYPATAPYGRNAKNLSPSPHTRRDQVPKSKPTLANSGTKNDLTRRQKLAQCYQHERTTSSKKLIPVVGLNCTSHKRHVESASCHRNSKKLRPESASGERQIDKSPADKSLRTSPVSQPSSKHHSCLELSRKARRGPLQLDMSEQAGPPGRLSTSKGNQSHDTSQLPKHCNRPPRLMGVKQAILHPSKNDTIRIISPSYRDFSEESINTNEANDKNDQSGSPHSSRKDNGSSSHPKVDNHHFGYAANSVSALTVKSPGKRDQTLERRKSDTNIPKQTSKPSSSNSSRHTDERPKSSRVRRHTVIPDDMEKLFTPDPLIYIASPPRKMIKKEGEKHKSSTLEKHCLSRATFSSSSLVTESSSHETQNGSATTVLPRIFSPKLILKRVKSENLSPVRTKLNKSPSTSPDVQPKYKKYKVDCRRSPPPSNNVSQHKLQQAAASQCTSTSSGSHSPPLERQDSGRSRKLVKVDPIAVDLDLDFSLALDFEVTQSSHSSGEEGEPLLSLQEIMEHASKFPDTPEKGAFSEPSTPGFGSPPVRKLLPSTMKSGTYKNNLEQMLKEINSNKKATEIEMQLLDACKQERLRIEKFEEAEENREEAINAEQQEFLQRYSLMPSGFKEVPPGEILFNLEKLGQIFNQDTLQLRQCRVKPQGTAQKTLLWSSPAQLRLHVLVGLFQEAYDETPCPTEVTLFLFKMMSVHRERLVSDSLHQALCDIACTAACQGVNNGGLRFNVWVPSLADVTLILMNMGAAFVTLYPSENLQPVFTEGDLLEDVFVKSTSPSNEERSTFPEHNSNNVLKYMSHCLAVCPRAYSDDELLLLLTVVARISLDTRLILQSSGNPYLFQYRVIKSFRDWETMLPRICEALTDLTDDHHNMCHLVHLLPNNKRGKQLRQHLSLAMISKLLDGRRTYRPTQKDFELSKLRAYIPRMRPSSLRQGLLNSSGNTHKDEDGTHDQQAYYLCYSLLTLLNEASNLQFLFDHQKEQLLVLSAKLEAHVKCDIRESEKSLYRSKVKDLVARIDTKWQMLLQKTRPLHGKLYDYYQPVEALMSSQEEQEDGLLTASEDEGETTVTTENVLVAKVDEDTVEPGEDMEVGEERSILKTSCTTTDGSKTERCIEATPNGVNVDTPDIEKQTHNMLQPVDSW